VQYREDDLVYGLFRNGVLAGPGALVVRRGSLNVALPLDFGQQLSTTPGVPADAASSSGDSQRGARVRDLRQCGPGYPAASFRAKATGLSELSFLVDEGGRVVRARVDHGSGDDHAHELLDLAALIAIAKCDFEPGTVDGRRALRWVSIKFQWHIGQG
jgi:TonB family protein